MQIMERYGENRMNKIGARISEIIKISELTVSSFAIRTKNRQKNIANVVNGKNFPSWEVLYNICVNAPSIRGLEKLDVHWLITGKKLDSVDITAEGSPKYIKRVHEIEELKREIENLKEQLASKEEIIKLQNELLEKYRREIEDITN